MARNGQGMEVKGGSHTFISLSSSSSRCRLTTIQVDKESLFICDSSLQVSLQVSLFGSFTTTASLLEGILQWTSSIIITTKSMATFIVICGAINSSESVQHERSLKCIRINRKTNRRGIPSYHTIVIDSRHHPPLDRLWREIRLIAMTN